MDLRQDYHGDTHVFNKNVGENMIQCNRGCGANNLHWKIVNTKYKLFENNNLLHMCNDGVKANKAEMRRVTDNILEELGLSDPSDIPVAEVYEKMIKRRQKKRQHYGLLVSILKMPVNVLQSILLLMVSLLLVMISIMLYFYRKLHYLS